MTKRSLHVRFARNQIQHFFSSSRRSKKQTAEDARKVDIFGLLPRDIRIEILGYIAADRPAQIFSMRKVCRRWHEILNDDSIYHSALFTTSFSLPPPVISQEAFKDAAWADDRVRKHRLWKGRVILYGKCGLPENNTAQPSKVIYRDGIIAWWVMADRYFNYVDLNQEKNRKKVHIVNPEYKVDWVPLYAQAGGKLVFMRPRASQEEDTDHQGWGEMRGDRILNVVMLQVPLVKGVISLSKIERLNAGPWELYCSRNYALVLKGLELLVADIRDVSNMEVLHIIHLHKITSLGSPVINTIEINNRDNCLVVLTSRVTGCLEALSFSLTSGCLLKRFSTKTELECRKTFPPGTTYYIKHNNEFTREIPYQVQNPTHKERPAKVNVQNRWLCIPTEQGSRDECITGSYNDYAVKPNANIPRPLPQHCVTFGRQAVSFKALQDNFTPANVNSISLQIITGNVGAEDEDTDVPEADIASRHEIGSKIGITGTSIAWGHVTRMSAPIDCLIEDGDNIITDTYRWACQRRQWAQYSVLLGDEKALVLALPHHLMIWRFETPEIWKNRKKRKMLKLVSRAVMYTMLLPMYVGVAVVMFPFIVASCAKCAYKTCTARSPEECQNVRRSILQETILPEIREANG